MSRVYLIFRNQLFGDAIGAVLGTHPEIELVGATDNPDRVAAEVADLAPDVILLEEADDGPVISNVHRILSSPMPCRLITLRLDENGMHVWSQTWRQTVSPQDLVEAVITAGELKS
jgi:chemotaxis response regulator CheB